MAASRHPSAEGQSDPADSSGYPKRVRWERLVAAIAGGTYAWRAVASPETGWLAIGVGLALLSADILRGPLPPLQRSFVERVARYAGTTLAAGLLGFGLIGVGHSTGDEPVAAALALRGVQLVAVVGVYLAMVEAP